MAWSHGEEKLGNVLERELQDFVVLVVTHSRLVDTTIHRVRLEQFGAKQMYVSGRAIS